MVGSMEHDPSILEDSYRLQDGTIAVDAVSGISTSSWKSLMPTPVPPTGFEWRKLALSLVVFPQSVTALSAMSPCLPRLARLFLLSPVASPIKKSQLVWDAVSALWGLLTEPSTGSAMSYSLITARGNQKSVANSMSNIATAVWGLGL